MSCWERVSCGQMVPAWAVSALSGKGVGLALLAYHTANPEAERVFVEGQTWFKVPLDRLTRFGWDKKQTRMGLFKTLKHRNLIRTQVIQCRGCIQETVYQLNVALWCKLNAEDWEMDRKSVKAKLLREAEEDGKVEVKDKESTVRPKEPKVVKPARRGLGARAAVSNSHGQQTMTARSTDDDRGRSTKDDRAIIYKKEEKEGGKEEVLAGQNSSSSSSPSFALEEGSDEGKKRSGVPVDGILRIALARGVRTRTKSAGDVTTKMRRNMRKLWQAVGQSMTGVEAFFDRVKASKYLMAEGAFEEFDEHKRYGTLSWLLDSGPDGDWGRIDAVLNGEFDDKVKCPVSGDAGGPKTGSAASKRTAWEKVRVWDLDGERDVLAPRCKIAWPGELVTAEHEWHCEPTDPAWPSWSDGEEYHGAVLKAVESTYEVGDQIEERLAP